MSKLQVNLSKPGDKAPKLALNLSKGDLFRVRLSWDGEADLDLHALHAVNYGDGGSSKVSSMEDILSTYNVQRKVRGGVVGELVKAPDGSFAIYGGAMKHSPDATDGNAHGDDEWVEINPGRLNPPAGGAIDIPLIAMIHPQGTGRTFKDVVNARVIIEDADGKVLFDVSLSDQFDTFIGVQMGSILVSDEGSHFTPAGTGFNSDFNEVLAHFS